MSARKERLRRQGRIYGPLTDFVRGGTCCVVGCRSPGLPHHVRAIGSGSSREDWLPLVHRQGRMVEYVAIVGNVAPLCALHHDHLHVSGRALDMAHPLDEVAATLGRVFAHKHPDEFNRLDELYAGFALRKPELCFAA